MNDERWEKSRKTFVDTVEVDGVEGQEEERG